MARNNKGSRRQQILQCLARMLETSSGSRITTAALAMEVGVSEAALYRHFPSKTKMYEALIEFIEETLFPRMATIGNLTEAADHRCFSILSLLLTFAERNPGITRLLTGEPLTGEESRLRVRIVQLYDRIETQLKTILREAEVRNGLHPVLDIADSATLMLAVAEGRISQYVRSGFSRSPTLGWQDQWQLLMTGFFRIAVTTPSTP